MKKRVSAKQVRGPSRQALILLAALLFVWISGCGSANSSQDMAFPEENISVSETMAAAESYAATDNLAVPEIGEGESSESGITQSIPSDSSLPLDRKLIRNVSMEVETTSFDELITSVQDKVRQLGGYTEQSNISGNSITSPGSDTSRYASMVLRIPAQQLDAFVEQVEQDGNVTYKSETVSDVTLQYSDVESRLKTLRTEQERLWELLAQAETTEAIIALEQRLSEVTSEIESRESRLRYLDNSVTYSTVNLSISEVDTESPTQPENAFQQISRGFSRNLRNLLYGLSSLAIGLLSGSPYMIFLALVIFLLFFPVRWLKRRKSRKEKKQAQSSPSEKDEPAHQSDSAKS